MLAIKVNTEFLDLPADLAMELERNNPFLSDSIQGEFSLGLTLRYTEKNYRLLQYTGNFYKPNKKYTVDAAIYDAGIFRYAGKLVISQHQSNMNNIEEIIWTGFFTIGSASFLQSIQDVLLSDIDYGGERSFPWTTTDPNDGSGGFWQHYHAARVPDAFPYVFYPITNDAWAPDLGTHWMNKLDTANNFETPVGDQYRNLEHGNAISAVPSIYLKFILESIFNQYGWKMSGEILDDIGFQKITIPSFRAIDWTDYKLHMNPTLVYQFTPFNNIVFDLADHVPHNVTIGSFLVSIKNRQGWWFDFDSTTKTAYLHGYAKVISSPAKDWSRYVQSNYAADYSDDTKVYSLVNNIDQGDSYPITMDIDESLVTDIDTTASFPPADENHDGLLCYVFQENNYYICQYNDTTTAWEWALYANNIGDYVPAGTSREATTPFESDISTMPDVLKVVDGRNVLVPICNQAGNYYRKNPDDAWGIRFLFYHGLFPDSGGINYPYASATNQAISGTPTGDWSLPYRHEYGAVNDGTYDYWWKAWLKLLSIQDMRTFTLALPVTELRKFTFSDIIFINNVFFVVQSAKETLPYKDLIEMKMKRIY